MDTSATNPNAIAKTLAAVLVLSVVGVLLTASRLTSSSAAVQVRPSKADVAKPARPHDIVRHSWTPPPQIELRRGS